MYALPITSHRPRRSQTVADQILTMMSEGQLRPGSRLPTESELCKRFDVSRTTLREAIQLLRARGLLEVCPGRGSFACQPDISALVSDLAFAIRLKTNAIDTEEIARIQSLTLQQAIPEALKAPVTERQKLFRYIVMEDSPVDTNLELEQQWQRNFMALGEQKNTAFSESLLYLLNTLSARRQQLSHVAEVKRTSQFQLRATTALVEGDKRLLQQAIALWIENISPTTSMAA